MDNELLLEYLLDRTIEYSVDYPDSTIDLDLFNVLYRLKEGTKLHDITFTHINDFSLILSIE